VGRDALSGIPLEAPFAAPAGSGGGDTAAKDASCPGSAGIYFHVQDISICGDVWGCRGL